MVQDAPQGNNNFNLRNLFRHDSNVRNINRLQVTLLHRGGWLRCGDSRVRRPALSGAGPPMPFKTNADRRHHIPKQRHRVRNWAAYDAALQARGSLTIWFTGEAVERWRAETRATPGGQRTYSDLAITTALTLRALFRLPLRQTEGLVGSLIQLLGVELTVPDHSTISRRAKTVAVPVLPANANEPVHLLVDRYYEAI
jgi:hypothetical protein